MGWINLDLLDSTEAPLAHRPFAIRWAGGGMIEGSTDERGRIRVEIPPGIARVSLTMLYRRFDLIVGALPPLESVAGVQARLNQLNHFAGPIDGDHGPMTANAVASFQRARAIPATGLADERTLAELAEEAGA